MPRTSPLDKVLRASVPLKRKTFYLDPPWGWGAEERLNMWWIHGRARGGTGHHQLSQGHREVGALFMKQRNRLSIPEEKHLERNGTFPHVIRDWKGKCQTLDSAASGQSGELETEEGSTKRSGGEALTSLEIMERTGGSGGKNEEAKPHP